MECTYVHTHYIHLCTCLYTCGLILVGLRLWNRWHCTKNQLTRGCTVGHRVSCHPLCVKEPLKWHLSHYLELPISNMNKKFAKNSCSSYLQSWNNHVCPEINDDSSNIQLALCLHKIAKHYGLLLVYFNKKLNYTNCIFTEVKQSSHLKFLLSVHCTIIQTISSQIFRSLSSVSHVSCCFVCFRRMSHAQWWITWCQQPVVWCHVGLERSTCAFQVRQCLVADISYILASRVTQQCLGKKACYSC